MKAKRVVLAACVAAALGASVVGCSGVPGSARSTSDPLSSSAAKAITDGRVYTKADLDHIAKVVLAKLDLKDGEITAEDSAKVDPADQHSLLDQPGTTVTPAACAALVKTDDAQAAISKAKHNIGEVVAGLTYAITITTLDDQPLPDSVKSRFGKKGKARIDACRDEHIVQVVKGTTSTIDFDSAPMSVTTHADDAYGFTSGLPGDTFMGTASSPIMFIEAIRGNLLIEAVGFTNPNTATLEHAVDVTVAAAG